MQGPEMEVENTSSKHRGLIPRILEHLFDRIAQKHAAANAHRAGSLQFQVRCSYLEIYNETVTDLLDPSKVNLPVRENTREGTIYVDGLTWENVSSVAQTNALLHRGVRNRYFAGDHE
jgi:kinesin family protein 15